VDRPPLYKNVPPNLTVIIEKCNNLYYIGGDNSEKDTESGDNFSLP